MGIQGGGGKCALLGPVVQGGPLEMINFEQRPGKGEGGSQGVFCGRAFQRERTVNDAELGSCLVDMGYSKELGGKLNWEVASG